MELRAALRLGQQLLDAHDLPDWTVGLDRAKTRAGACRFGSRQITLSAQLTMLHDEGEVGDTLLHEIAHALVGPSHGHDAVWRRQAQAIGCTGHRLLPAEAPRVEGPWVGRCAAGHLVHRHRRPVRLLLCTRCRGPQADRVLQWTYRGRPVPMHPDYVTELRVLAAARR